MRKWLAWFFRIIFGRRLWVVRSTCVHLCPGCPSKGACDDAPFADVCFAAAEDYGAEVRVLKDDEGCFLVAVFTNWREAQRYTEDRNDGDPASYYYPDTLTLVEQRIFDSNKGD